MYCGKYSPPEGELYALCNGLLGWSPVRGLGPKYFAPPSVEEDLRTAIAEGNAASLRTRSQLASARARVVNFFALLDRSKPIVFKTARDFEREVDTFLAQLKAQAEIWEHTAFGALDFSPAEKGLYHRAIAKIAPVLYTMGFADAIPHAGQVSRLTATMANSLNARPSQVLQAGIVGFLHDPKFHPGLDLGHQNLATHPVVAAALAYLVFQDATLRSKLREYFHGNKLKAAEFVDGMVDALSVNNDSRFVQMFVILPVYLKRIGEVFGDDVATDLKSVMERRLESASLGTAPPEVPRHLHGCLEQVTFDSGLRGISLQGWKAALAASGIETKAPVALFRRLIDGKASELTSESVEELARQLANLPHAVLSVKIRAADLLHHHQEVAPAGRKAAEALVIADPMMLSPHKVASVYNTAIVERLDSYLKSFEDNIRLLPRSANRFGRLWQRAVYLSLLDAADRLNGTSLLVAFKNGRPGGSLKQDIDDLRALVLAPATWGSFAHATGTPADSDDIRRALEALENAYVATVNQYREAAYAGHEDLNSFYPHR